MSIYPCNRGMPLPQGYHSFIYSNGKVLCSLCGFLKEENLGNSTIRRAEDNVVNDTDSKSVLRRRRIENGESL